jgi:hypothetical protein
LLWSLAYLAVRNVLALVWLPPIGERRSSPEPLPLDRLRRRDLLGGLLHEYELAA